MRTRARQYLLLAALFACGASRALGSDAMPAFAVTDRINPVDPMPERAIRWDDTSVALQDVVYATMPGYRPLHLDLYRPANSVAAHPLIVFVHGGGWAQANPRVGAGFKNFPAVLAHLAGRGYAVASIEYRLSSEAAFPAQLDDLRAALTFLRTQAPRLGIDASRIGLWGMSSGAQLAALQATDCGAGPCVQALAGWFGVYDLGAYDTGPGNAAVRALLRCGPAGCAGDSLAAASPLHFASAGDPPTLLVHGTADKGVPVAQSEEFAAALQKAGVVTQLLLVPAVGHGLVGSDATSTADALRQALQVTFEFFDRQLRAGLTPAATRGN